MVGDWVTGGDHNNHSGDNEITQSPKSKPTTASSPKVNIIISAQTKPKAGSAKVVMGLAVNKNSGAKVLLKVFRSEKYEYSVIANFNVLYAQSLETKELLEYRRTTLRSENIMKYSFRQVSGKPAEKKYNLHAIFNSINDKYLGYRITIIDENTNEKIEEIHYLSI